MRREFLSGLFCPQCQDFLTVKVEGDKGYSYCKKCGWKSPKRPVEKRYCETCGKRTLQGYSHTMKALFDKTEDRGPHYLCLECGEFVEGASV